MKKLTNVIWTKDGHEKAMQFPTKKAALKAANDPVYCPNDYTYPFDIVVSNEKTGEIILEKTENNL